MYLLSFWFRKSILLYSSFSRMYFSSESCPGLSASILKLGSSSEISSCVGLLDYRDLKGWVFSIMCSGESNSFNYCFLFDVCFSKWLESIEARRDYLFDMLIVGGTGRGGLIMFLVLAFSRGSSPYFDHSSFKLLEGTTWLSIEFFFLPLYILVHSNNSLFFRRAEQDCLSIAARLWFLKVFLSY